MVKPQWSNFRIITAFFLSVPNFQIFTVFEPSQQSDCAPSEDSDQPGHPPSLIGVFAVCLMGSSVAKLSSCGQRRLWSDWVDDQADPSLRWAHTHFVGFVMLRLIFTSFTSLDIHYIRQKIKQTVCTQSGRGIFNETVSHFVKKSAQKTNRSEILRFLRRNYAYIM